MMRNTTKIPRPLSRGAATHYLRAKRLACIIILTLSLPGGMSIAQAPATSPEPSPAVSDLESEKLALEVEKLRLENAAATDPFAQKKLSLEIEKLRLENANSERDLFTLQGWTNLVYTNLSLFTAVFVGAWALYKYLSERTKSRLEREEERFEQIARGLGGEHDQGRVSSAVLLPTFLQPQYERFYEQVFNLAAGNLRAQLPHKRNTRYRHQKESPHGDGSQSVELKQSLIKTLTFIFRESYPKARESVFRKHMGRTRGGILRRALGRIFRAFAPLIGPLGGRFFRKQSINPSSLVRSHLNAAHVCLDEAYLDNADLRFAWLRDASLQRATLKGVKLEHAVLEKGQLQYAVLVDADLSNANLKGADFTHATLLNLDLSGARVDGAIFDNSDLTSSKFIGCTAIAARFRDADLTDVVFENVIFDAKQPTNIELAKSLAGAVLTNVKGLTQVQKDLCIAKGATIN